jgi:hypothetical protein
MARFMPDTNCLVALLVAWHEDHERAVAEMERRLAEGETLVMARHFAIFAGEDLAVVTPA